MNKQNKTNIHFLKYPILVSLILCLLEPNKMEKAFDLKKKQREIKNKHE